MIYVLNMDNEIINICSDWEEFDDMYGNSSCVIATDNEADIIGSPNLMENKDA